MEFTETSFLWWAHVVHWTGWKKTFSGWYSMRESHRLGFGSHCESHAELLNRIVSVGTDSDGRRFVRIEPDIRHAELVPEIWDWKEARRNH